MGCSPIRKAWEFTFFMIRRCCWVGTKYLTLSTKFLIKDVKRIKFLEASGHVLFAIGRGFVQCTSERVEGTLQTRKQQMIQEWRKLLNLHIFLWLHDANGIIYTASSSRDASSFFFFIEQIYVLCFRTSKNVSRNCILLIFYIVGGCQSKDHWSRCY